MNQAPIKRAERNILNDIMQMFKVTKDDRMMRGSRKRRQALREYEREHSEKPSKNFTTFSGRLTQWKDGVLGYMTFSNGQRRADTKPRGRGRYDWKRQKAEARKAAA